MSPNSDLESLILAAQSGDGEAVRELCERIYPDLKRLVRRSLARESSHNPPWRRALFSTGDVVQDVFLNVLRDLSDFRGRTRGELLSYLATLTKNRLIDAVRFFEASRRDRRRIEPDFPDRDVARVELDRDNPEQDAMYQEEVIRFYHALQRFSERDRNLLRERIENHRPFAEIAEMLGYASADSTRKAFHVAQAKLLIRLDRPTA